jgi:exosortase
MSGQNVTVEHLPAMSARLAGQNLWFLLFWFLSLVPFHAPLRSLVSLSFQDERYSHVVMIPFISLLLLWLERRRIFLESDYCSVVGTPLLLLGVVVYSIGKVRTPALGLNDSLSVMVFGMVLVWIAGFVLCYGTRSFRAALFPLFFLLLMIPIPTLVLDNTVLALQEGSSQMTYALFKLLGVPVFWQGFKFSLPGVEIEIAKECSGIRSSLALFITGILAAHVFLRSGWRMVVLSLSTIPLAIFKNAVRIVTLSWLGVYVDRSFLFGRLHHQGGILFALIALAIFVPLLFALQKSESRAHIRHLRLDSRANEGTGPTSFESTC